MGFWWWFKAWYPCPSDYRPQEVNGESNENVIDIVDPQTAGC